MAYRLIYNDVLKDISELTASIQHKKEFNYGRYLNKEIPENSRYISLNPKEEEDGIQQLVQKQLELLTKKEILIENQHTQVSERTRGYIMEDELRFAIERINKQSIIETMKKHNRIIDETDLSYKEVEFISKLINKMTNDIIDKIMSIINKNNSPNKNIRIYQQIFEESNFIDIDGERYYYQVIDKNSNLHNESSKNELKIIRERNLLNFNGTRERPDFAIFFNGLPFLILELKRTTIGGLSGENFASQDYRSKTSYHNFLACIGSNGNNTFISSNPKMKNFFLWMEYSKSEYDNIYEKSLDNSNGLYDLFIDLFSDINKMLFYFESCVMISETGKYLKNARIQQFRTAYKVFELLKNQESKNKIRKYFQHHARTGKTFTFKIIAKMLWKKKVGNFKKVIFFVPDTSSVLPSVKKEFMNLHFPNGEAVTIESKEDYSTKMQTVGNEFYFFLVNMQKITENNENLILDDGNDVFIFIDEVHFAQNEHIKLNKSQYEEEYKTLAKKRSIQFPNASFLSATASPLMEITKDGENIDLTEIMYGECIDKLTQGDAVKLKLVVPLVFYKHNYNIDNGILKEFNENDAIKEQFEKMNIKETIDTFKMKKESILNNFCKKYQVSENVKQQYYREDFIESDHKINKIKFKHCF